MSTEAAAPARGYSGTRFVVISIVTFFVLCAIVILSAPMTFRKRLSERPAKLATHYAEMERALRAYAADHGGALPPEIDLFELWRSNKSYARARNGRELTTMSIGALTTPVAYLPDPFWGDPYSAPEQHAPTAYIVRPADNAAVLWSPGPNLRYEISPEELRALPWDEMTALLSARTYDPTNGTRSGGDVPHIVLLGAPSAP